jgi:cell division septum initiation protein DivIVA
MSVFEPSTESDRHYPSDAPQFRVAVRGFDRQEVAAYVQELWAHLEDQRQRAEQAERTIAQLQLEMAAVKSQSPSFEHLGVGAAKVLEQAGHSAELLVDEAESRGKAIVEDAQAQAAELLAAAERRAEQVRSNTLKEARQTLDEARAAAERTRRESQEERAQVGAETQRLRSFHDHLLERLHEVRQDLSALLGVPEDQAAEDQAAEDQAAEPEGPAASAEDGGTPELAATQDR